MHQNNVFLHHFLKVSVCFSNHGVCEIGLIATESVGRITGHLAI